MYIETDETATEQAGASQGQSGDLQKQENQQGHLGDRCGITMPAN